MMQAKGLIDMGLVWANGVVLVSKTRNQPV
jgi:hypothetical protein